MRDPQEGLTEDGWIRTGVDRARVPDAFRPIVRDVIDEFRRSNPPSAELQLYGSVANGTARPGSDVDLVVIGARDGWAGVTAERLSQRYAGTCRGVEIASSAPSDYEGPDDEAYGNRVFLRHYCVSLAGPDAIRSSRPFPGDARAARGFNGDIARCLQRWRTGEATARRVARKTLVAAAGIASVRGNTWTTDRTVAAEMWCRLAPHDEVAVRDLVGWADGSLDATPDGLDAALAPGGIVSAMAERFAAEIGLWA